MLCMHTFGPYGMRLSGMGWSPSKQRKLQKNDGDESEKPKVLRLLTLPRAPARAARMYRLTAHYYCGHFSSPLMTLALTSSNSSPPRAGYTAFIVAINVAESLAMAACFSNCSR